MTDHTYIFAKNLHVHHGKSAGSHLRERRQAFRVKTSGVTAKINKSTGVFLVKDLSVNGISLIVPDGIFMENDAIVISLSNNNKEYLSNLEGVVVRTVDHDCACILINVTRNQEIKLDKLVLEMQKYSIIQQKMIREKEILLMHDDSLKTNECLHIKLDGSSFI